MRQRSVSSLIWTASVGFDIARSIFKSNTCFSMRRVWISAVSASFIVRFSFTIKSSISWKRRLISATRSRLSLMNFLFMIYCCFNMLIFLHFAVFQGRACALFQPLLWLHAPTFPFLPVPPVPVSL
ncbi:hypothetical protein Barb4_04078 [Bacteroidales bacterium Barb4]|nr:hypothetical protein Barb4_04078 [Bacteroidales bacterium Barb4]